jgi:multidrug efflux system membrane fusion protein
MVAAMLSSCSRIKPAAPSTLPVTVEQPKVMEVTDWDEYPGHLEAVESVEIRPRVSGNIDAVYFKEGSEVKVGDVLFLIDPRPYQAELDRAKAERQRADTRVELAQNDLGRADSLIKSKAISAEVYDSRSKTLRDTEAGVASAKAAEALAQLNFDFTQIKSPINGRVGRQLVTAGNLVQAGAATPLATIVSLDPVYCYFDVDESVYLQYRGPDGNGIASKDKPVGCELSIDSEAGYQYHGHVDFIDNQVNRQMGTIRLRGAFDNRDRSLLPGLFGKIRVPVRAPRPQVCIPSIAVCSDQGQMFVYVVSPEGTAEVRSIKPGRRHGTLWAIQDGLKPSDNVIVKGMLMLRPGAPVTVQQGSVAKAN